MTLETKILIGLVSAWILLALVVLGVSHFSRRRLCQTWLGDFFFRTLAHDWQTTIPGEGIHPDLEQQCSKCGDYHHFAGTDGERVWCERGRWFRLKPTDEPH